MPKIVPSLLSADFTRLRDQIQALERAGAQRLHLDVMDGHFVPNLTIGPFIVEAIRRITDLHLETHLMIENPMQYLDAFVKAGSDTVIIHIETSADPRRELEAIRERGAKAGIVINPPTDFTRLENALPHIDHLLIMTVNPGFGGQKMISEALGKVSLAKPYQERYGFPIEVDGGVNLGNLNRVRDAGADLLVAGSAVFKGGQPGRLFLELSEQLNR